MALNNNVGLFNVCPPTLEDAGLENAALPSHAIQEAFKLAADAMQSTAVHVFGGVRTDEEDRAKSLGRGIVFEEESTANPNRSAALGEEESCVDTKNLGKREED